LTVAEIVTEVSESLPLRASTGIVVTPLGTTTTDAVLSSTQLTIACIEACIEAIVACI
jgi:hypothetical protein